MYWRRSIAVVVLVLAATLVHAEEKYRLQEKVAVGDQWQVALDMQLAGDLEIKSGEKNITLKLSATAMHKFPERVLSVSPNGQPTRVARSYDEAKAAITVQGQSSTRTLRPERKFQVTQRIKDQTVTFSPVGPLTRDELELTGEHLDVVSIFGLLPAEPVAVGETWKVPHIVAQSLAGLDGITTHDLACKLEEVKAGQARVSASGSVVGISNGAEIKAVIDGHYTFDVQTKRLMSLVWKQKDEREHGPVSPAAKTETTTTVKRTFGGGSESLLAGVIETVPAEPGPAHLLLSYRDPQSRWEFLYDRGWHIVSRGDQYTVMRLLDRGELVAQLNITPWTKAKPGEHISPEQLRKHIDGSAGLTIDQVLQADRVPDDEGRWVYRLSLAGQANELKLLQNYYAVAGSKGDQVILTFTTELPQAEKLGERDLEIVGSLTFPGTERKPAK